MKSQYPKYFKSNENSWFGEYSHSWPDKAGRLNIPKHIESLAKPRTDEFYNKVISKITNSEIEEWKEIAKHPESVIKSDINKPWTGFPKSIVEGKWKIKVDSLEEQSTEVLTSQGWLR